MNTSEEKTFTFGSTSFKGFEQEVEETETLEVSADTEKKSSKKSKKKSKVEEPVLEEPAVEETVVEEPVVEETVVEEPVVEEPVVEEPAVEETVVEEPVAEEPAKEAVVLGGVSYVPGQISDKELRILKGKYGSIRLRALGLM